MKNANNPAFPIACPPDFQFAEPGLTKREYAAITLRVPNSGDHALDAMIRAAERRDMAAMAMQGLLDLTHNAANVAHWAVKYADALIAELAKAEPEAETAQDDVWIAWNGGDCPVGPDQWVRVEVKAGGYITSIARSFRWTHINEGSDIIRYRIVKGGEA